MSLAEDAWQMGDAGSDSHPAASDLTQTALP
ncbi:MAG: hypothetical protein XD82_1594 [Methanoculleus marisnigri]|uniref:Uncharacterized protein n=1 Tax=Methanoculleus marisnigri TaxID=2198 RepID=A0A117LPN9_9EURY|nr:MAG: hypothetical protein XD82_1594 [Methanoculleus marisnigri]